MKSLLTITFFIYTLPIGYVQGPSNSQVPRIADPIKFDEWGDIPFSDEKARLDNAAIALRKEIPRNIIHLVIYAGQRACVGEARARGMRAAKYLVKRGVAPSQVAWIDGGHQRALRIELWIWPPEVGKPSVFPEFNLKPSEVRLEKNCKIKRRRSRA